MTHTCLRMGTAATFDRVGIGSREKYRASPRKIAHHLYAIAILELGDGLDLAQKIHDAAGTDRASMGPIASEIMSG